MLIAGTSTLHDWQCPASDLKARAEIQTEGSELKAVTSMWVEVLPLSIKSEKGEDMDEKIYETLKTDQHKKITYNMSRVNGMTKEGNQWVLKTSGSLTIAGTTKVVDMTVKASVNAAGEVVFNGTKKIKLSTFGMERPSAMMGMITAGDEITLTFELTMKKSS
jgi:polyisoprenoid-binding protein YceI